MERADHGFFGPESPTWRVWTHAAGFVGFQRAVAIQALDPNLSTAVAHAGGVYTRPADRYDRTTTYFLQVALADGATAVAASRRLFKRHAPMTGIEPIRGTAYAANDPASQLWIHVTAWHSLLCCYERFGPGRLSPEDEERYWRECAIAAQLQPIDVADVPTSRAQVREYFERTRPTLCLGEDGKRLFRHLTKPALRSDAPLHSVMWRLTSFACIATMPRWMRELGGIRQSRVTDAVAITLTRIAVAAMQPLPIRRRMLGWLAPRARPVFEGSLRAPRTTRTVSFDEAVAIVDGG